MLSDVHPAQVAGLFYPAEAQSLRDLIRQMAQGSAARRRRRSESRRRAARRHRLFRLGRRDRLRAMGAAAPIRPADRHRRPGAPGRLPRAGDPSGDGLEHAARRGEGRARSPRPPRGSKGCDGRRAAVRRRAFARDAPRDAAGHADGAVRNPADPRRRRRAAAGRRSAAARLGRPGDGDRRLVRSVALPRPGQRRGDRLGHRPADREARRELARRQAGLRLSADHGGADDRRGTGLEGERPAPGDLGRRRRGIFAGRRLRRLRFRIRRLGAAERGRPHGPALDLHGGARRGGEAGRTQAGAPHRRPPVARPLRAARDFRHAFPGAAGFAAASVRRNRDCR